MASLLTESDINSVKILFRSLHETFYRSIIVFKEPIRTLTNNQNTSRGYAGFGPPVSTNIVETYTPVSGDFLGIIEYKDDQIENEFIAGKTSIPEGEVRLEVLQNVHDYIQSGHTESIYFDDTHFNVKSGPSISDFQGFRTFAYKLEKTN